MTCATSIGTFTVLPTEGGKKANDKDRKCYRNITHMQLPKKKKKKKKKILEKKFQKKTFKKTIREKILKKSQHNKFFF